MNISLFYSTTALWGAGMGFLTLLGTLEGTREVRKKEKKSLWHEFIKWVRCGVEHQKNWCFWTVVLEKTLESPLDCKEIQPVHPKGDQSQVFIGRTDAEAETPVLWPPHAKSGLIWKHPDAGKDWMGEEKGMTEDEMAGWHHQLGGHGFGWTPAVGDGQGGLASCGSWVTRSQTWLSNWTELN